jgi:protein involved in polysaccharide export with SLBB domain
VKHDERNPADGRFQQLLMRFFHQGELKAHMSNYFVIFFLCTCILSLEACAHKEITVASPELAQTFTTEPAKQKDHFALPEKVDSLSKDTPSEYLLGPGDELSLKVWNKPEISEEKIIVGPDGVINILRVGAVKVVGRTRDDVTREIARRLSAFYETPEVTLAVKNYNNNKAFVLGRVENPGVVKFPGNGTLLEALSLAGGLPVRQSGAFLTKCAIIRGKNQIIWIDLRELLNNGNMALNAPIHNNDVIFIPESEDEMVYVMGEVKVPGAVKLKTRLTYLDALMLAGGPTEDANTDKTYLIRFDGKNGLTQEIDLKGMLSGADLTRNFLLQDNDIIYVAKSGLSDFNYVLRQVLPALQIMDLTTNVLERFGTMPSFREHVYGQDPNSSSNNNNNPNNINSTTNNTKTR